MNGFVYAINHGYTQAQVSLINPLPFNHSLIYIMDQHDQIFDIADVPFTAMPPEEMKLYTVDIEKLSHYAGPCQSRL